MRMPRFGVATSALMSTSADFLAYVLDQLAQLRGVSSRRMFGGVGLYCDEFFFGLIAEDVLYLRVDDSNRADYAARGAARFRPYADRPHLSMNYYEAPADVLEDAAQLVTWAQRSVQVAVRAPPAPARKAAAKRGARKGTPSARRRRSRQ
jgi:DNA transformation protein and related proteins